MKATLVSYLAMQLTIGAAYVVDIESVTSKPTTVATVSYERQEQDIELAGFVLTPEEWQEFDPAAHV